MIKNSIMLLITKLAWRRNNRHNDTYADGVFPIRNISVGRNSYGPINIIMMDRTAKVKIGNYCSIGPSVKFLVGGGARL